MGIVATWVYTLCKASKPHRFKQSYRALALVFIVGLATLCILPSSKIVYGSIPGQQRREEQVIATTWVCILWKASKSHRFKQSFRAIALDCIVGLSTGFRLPHPGHKIRTDVRVL